MSVAAKINEVMKRVCKISNDGWTESGPKFSYLRRKPRPRR